MDISEVKEKNRYYERIIKELEMENKSNEVIDVQKVGADGITFRASGAGYLMVEPKEKSPLNKYLDACALVGKLQGEYDGFSNVELKSAKNKLESLRKAEKQRDELLINKGDLHISESTKTNLIDVFISHKYSRKEEIDSKFLSKGNECEEDNITLVSRVLKRLFKKNTERKDNGYVTGEWDLQIEENGKIIETIDTKTSWSAQTFFRAQKDELNKMYYWQGIVYMWLTGAKKHTVAYGLVNGLASAITDEKRRLSFKAGMIDSNGNESEDFKKRCKQIEINHIFDLELFKKHNPYFEFHNNMAEWVYDIPKEERVFTFTFDRNEEDIERLKNRIIECRKWMNTNLYKK